MSYHRRRVIALRITPPKPRRWWVRLWQWLCYLVLRNWQVGKARVRHALRRVGEWFDGGTDRL